MFRFTQDSPGVEPCVLVDFNSPIVLFQIYASPDPGVLILFFFYQPHTTHGSKSFNNSTVPSGWNRWSLAHVYVNPTVVIAIWNLNRLKSSAILHPSVAWCSLVSEAYMGLDAWTALIITQVDLHDGCSECCSERITANRSFLTKVHREILRVRKLTSAYARRTYFVCLHYMLMFKTG